VVVSTELLPAGEPFEWAWDQTGSSSAPGNVQAAAAAGLLLRFITVNIRRRRSASPSPAGGRGRVREPVWARTLSWSGVAQIAMTG
jgi:hypothetical protein